MLPLPQKQFARECNAEEVQLSMAEYAVVQLVVRLTQHYVYLPERNVWSMSPFPWIAVTAGMTQWPNSIPLLV